MAFTHDDIYKAMPGYKVMTSHFHMHFNDQLTDAGTIDVHPTWVDVFRGLGINIANLADFHGDSHPNDPGPLRFAGAEGLLRRLPPFLRSQLPADPRRGARRHFRRPLHHFMFRARSTGRRRGRASSSPRTIRKYGKVYHVEHEGGRTGDAEARRRR